MRKMLKDYREEKFALEELDEDKFKSYLDTADIPIRTC